MLHLLNFSLQSEEFIFTTRDEIVPERYHFWRFLGLFSVVDWHLFELMEHSVILNLIQCNKVVHIKVILNSRISFSMTWLTTRLSSIKRSNGLNREGSKYMKKLTELFHRSLKIYKDQNKNYLLQAILWFKSSPEAMRFCEVKNAFSSMLYLVCRNWKIKPIREIEVIS